MPMPTCSWARRDQLVAGKRRLEEAGYAEGFVPDAHPHRLRMYFLDADGLEWEFVYYYSDDPAERNDYSDV